MDPHKELRRIEAFSDGVFAIACTLLILEITVPHVGDVLRPGALWSALRHEWPSFAAYLIGFETIFVAWAGHDRALVVLVRSSKAFVYANGLLLLAIAFVPFPTAVLAEYINTPQANVAVMLYCAAQLALNLCFIVWWISMFRPVRLFPDTYPVAEGRTVMIQMLSGAVLYTGTMVISYWFPITGLVIIVACHVLWIAVTLREHWS